MTPDSRQNGHHDPREIVLECQMETISNCSVVHVRGEIDVATIPIFKKALDSAIAVPHPIIVDLAEASYIDSTGIHALLLAKERHHKTLAVAAVAPALIRIFELVEVDRVIPSYETLDAALSAECASSASSGAPHS
jgi:anti-sigma B factor antagonist